MTTASTSRDERNERLTFLRPLALPGIEMLSAYNSGRAWHVFHEHYAICACPTAAAGWRYRGRSYVLEDGSSMLVEPGEVHRNTWIGKQADFKVVFVEPDVFASAAKELGVRDTPHFSVAQTENPVLLEAAFALVTSVETDATLLEQQSRLAECMRLMLGHVERQPHAPREGQPQWPVRRAQAYLREHFREPVNLVELAAISRMSPFHLARTFERQVGLPPHAYQMHVRVEEARRLLARGVSAGDAAARTGFADQSHFARWFKRIMYVTPREYVRAALSSRDEPAARPMLKPSAFLFRYRG